MRSLTATASIGDTPLHHRCLLALRMFLSVSAFSFLEPFVPLYLEQSGLRRTEIGMVSGIGTALALLIQPVLGRLSDRLDARRPLMVAAAIAAGCAYLAYRSANNLVAFVLLTAVGVNGVMYLNTANAVLVGRLSSRAGSTGGCGGTFASYRVWGSVGYVMMSLLSGWLLNRSLAGHGGISRATIAPLFLYAPLLFFVIALVVLFLPDPRREEVVAPPEDASDRYAPAPGACARNFQRFLQAYFLFIFAYCGCGAYLSLYLRSLGATPLWITGVFAAGVTCEAIVMTQAGRMSDRFGRRPLLAVAFLFMPIRLLLYSLASGPAWVMGVQTLHGINFGIMVALAVAFINDLCAEENRGAMQSRLAATGGIAAASAPVVSGWIAQQFGIRWTFGVMACVAAVGAALFLWKVRETHPTTERLYRCGPECLRPVLSVLCVPGAWLSRAAAARQTALRRMRREA